jgi:thiol-disulfide isomerase/thioredoxin
MLTNRILVVTTGVLGAAFLCGGPRSGSLRAAEDANAATIAVSSPRPYVGAANVYPHGLVMQWLGVENAESYSVHLGAGSNDLSLLSFVTAPRLEVDTALAWGKCYHWRADTHMTSTTTIPGPLWRFTVVPPRPNDPDLLAWYAFDEVAGSISVDLSGNGVNAILERMIWDIGGAPGLEGGSVRSDGSGDVRFGIIGPTPPLQQATLTGWFRIGRQDELIPLWYIARGTDSYVSLVPQPANGGGLVIEVMVPGQSQPTTAQAMDPLPVDHWTHLAVTMDGAGEQVTVYEDGAVVLAAQGLTGLKSVLEAADFVSMGNSFPLDNCLHFSVDEVRLYTKILNAEEIARSMLGHPDSPYEPEPRHWAQVHTSTPAVLRWKATDGALAYNVYAGTDVNHLDLAGENLTKPECPLKQMPADGQTLCWQVEAVVGDGFVRGPLWQFSATGLSLADVIKGATPWWADYGKYYRQVAPDLSLTDMEGRGHRVRDYRGKHLLLVVWAPWCSVCRGELVTLSKLRKEMSEAEMMLLSVTDESNRSAMPAFLADHPEVNFPVCVTTLSALPPFNSVTHYPSIFYVAQDGTIKLGTVGAVPLEIIKSTLQAAWPYEP